MVKRQGRNAFKYRKEKNNKRKEEPPTKNTKWGRMKEINNLKNRVTNLRNASVILVKEDANEARLLQNTLKAACKKIDKKWYSKENKIETAQP